MQHECRTTWGTATEQPDFGPQDRHERGLELAATAAPAACMYLSLNNDQDIMV